MRFSLFYQLPCADDQDEVTRYRETIEHKTSDDNPENTSVKGTHRLEVTLTDRVVLWEAELDFSSDLENFYYRYVRRVSENGDVVRENEWEHTFKRDYQ